MAWNLRFDDHLEHLKITKFRNGLYEIKFDLTKFYQNIVSNLQELERKYFKKQVQKEYNSWFIHRLGKLILRKMR